VTLLQLMPDYDAAFLGKQSSREGELLDDDESDSEDSRVITVGKNKKE
jgi:hypothetical protein